jgi:hypothetical protein
MQNLENENSIFPSKNYRMHFCHRQLLQDLFSKIPEDVLNENTGMNKSQNAHFTLNKFFPL